MLLIFTFQMYPGYSNIYIGPLRRMCGLDPQSRKMEFCFPIGLTNLVRIACSSPPLLCPSPSSLRPHGKQESCLLHSILVSTYMSSYVACLKKKSTAWTTFISISPSHRLTITWKVYMNSLFLPFS